MENNVKLIESLLESSFKYGLAEIELIRLKALNKTSDVVSGLVPHAVVFFFFVVFLFFLNFGLAFWLGEILGNNFYGFFVIAAFYAIVGLIMHFFLHKWIKRKIGNFLVKQMFN